MIAFIIGGAVLLGVSIFVHELGHFLLGRAVGIRVETFSVGFGKAVWKRQVGDTTYQISMLPLGGYVKFYGDEIDRHAPADANREDESSDRKSADDSAKRTAIAPAPPPPGSFYACPPLLRIIPVLGGPLFNLLLGLVIYLILHTLSGPLAPQIAIWEETRNDSPAWSAGLRTGDEVEAINGRPARTFYDIKQTIALSGGNSINFDVLRDGEPLQFTVEPLVDSAGISYVGLRPPGERNLEVNYPSFELLSYRISSLLGANALPPRTLRAMESLNNGDIIRSVEGVRPVSILHLQQILGEHHGKEVDVVVDRQVLPIIAPWFKREERLSVPTSAEYRVRFTDLIDKKYGTTLPDQQIQSSAEEHLRGLALIRVDGAPVGSYERLAERFTDAPGRVDLAIAERNYEATIEVERIGLMGFRARDRFESEYLARHESAFAVVDAALRDTYGAIMIYPAFFERLFSGRISFAENARGPVGMFAMAGVIFNTGYREYLQLFAAISIALMVMNLLPFPIVDGGHILFFLYEAIVGRPVSQPVMEAMYRFAFVSLISLGLFIMYKDILFVMRF